MALNDVIIIGGSYAGLSAAMSLGRSMRKVTIIDSGKPCNQPSRTAHNLLGQDGIRPGALREKAIWEIMQYPTVGFLDDEAETAFLEDDIFQVKTKNGNSFKAKKLIFATGITDEMPDIEGFEACWGVTVLHCPYCHGYEYRGKKTAIIASGNTAFEFAELISQWTKDLFVLTNGDHRMNEEQLQLLANNNIAVINRDIRRIEHENGVLKRICFTDETFLELQAAYARPFMKQQCSIPEELGCELHSIHIKVDQYQQSSVHGVFAAGDNCSPLRSLANAIAAGSVAGAYINKEMIHDEFCNRKESPGAYPLIPVSHHQ